MLGEYHHRYNKWHGAGKHSTALSKGGQFLPELGITKHPQCFSGMDELKTDEFLPINAYRAFYKADKLKILLNEVKGYRDRGELWYPMF